MAGVDEFELRCLRIDRQLGQLLHDLIETNQVREGRFGLRGRVLLEERLGSERSALGSWVQRSGVGAVLRGRRGSHSVLRGPVLDR